MLSLQEVDWTKIWGIISTRGSRKDLQTTSCSRPLEITFIAMLCLVSNKNNSPGEFYVKTLNTFRGSLLSDDVQYYVGAMIYNNGVLASRDSREKDVHGA